eukprot:1161447-Pelagomonas_calceolata.AAC.12
MHIRGSPDARVVEPKWKQWQQLIFTGLCRREDRKTECIKEESMASPRHKWMCFSSKREHRKPVRTILLAHGWSSTAGATARNRCPLVSDSQKSSAPKESKAEESQGAHQQ